MYPMLGLTSRIEEAGAPGTGVRTFVRVAVLEGLLVAENVSQEVIVDDADWNLTLTLK